MMGSHLEEEMEREYEDDDEPLVKIPPRCPELCPNFECVIKQNCTEACRSLDLIKGMICDICVHDTECTQKRKMALLGMEYFDKVKKRQQEETVGRVETVRQHHYHLEQKYKELKTKYITTSSLQFLTKSSLEQETRSAKTELQYTRHIMEMLKIKYVPEVTIAKEEEQRGISAKTLLMLVGVIVLIVVYVGATLAG